MPPEQNTELIFNDETVGTNVPKQFIPGVERGFRTMCEKGYYSGHKLAGVKFRLMDGMHHCVDSSELAFFLAAQGVMREAFNNGAWYLLEPIMLVEVTVPIEYQVKIHSGYIIVMQIVSCVNLNFVFDTGSSCSPIN